MNKQALKEELVDLRMKLTEAETQVNKILNLCPTDRFIAKAGWHIVEADCKLCSLAEYLGLNKLDLVKPRRVN